MANPLQFTDVFGAKHTEPSVSGIIRTQLAEPLPPEDLVNDLVILSPFRSGAPNVLKRFNSLAALVSAHDPDRVGDQGVALARTARAGIAEQDMFGAADLLTVRVGQPTQSTSIVRQSSTDLIEIATADYGAQTLAAKRQITAGTVTGKKVTLSDASNRTFVGDNLGPLMTVRCTGAVSAATLTIRRASASLAYGASQPSDGDTIVVNGMTFEFDDDDSVSGSNVAVAIGADGDATMAAFAAAVSASAPGVQGIADATANTVTLTGADVGVYATVGIGTAVTITPTGDAAAFVVTVTGASDGTQSLSLPLQLSGYKSIGQLVAYINSQTGYEAALSAYADTFTPSAKLDPIVSQSITATATLTGYAYAIANWINTRTEGRYTATVLGTGTPDNDASVVALAGGETSLPVASDWDTALAVVGADLERGGILLVDSDDPAIMAKVVTFIVERRANGQWFRAYFGAAAGQTTAQYLQIASSLNHSRARLVVQRPAIFAEGGGISYLPPIYLAAAIAGAAAGNRPWINPITNKRLRFAGLHPSDSWEIETRVTLLNGGVTVCKMEQGEVKVALHVTTSQDPDRRMPRIVSEIDTVDGIDSEIRAAFLPFRGKWTNTQVNARAVSTLSKVLRRFAEQGAIVPGVDEYSQPRAAYRLGSPAGVIEAGVLRLTFEVYVGGELNHISEVGNAEYQRLVGAEEQRGVTSLTTSVPIR